MRCSYREFKAIADMHRNSIARRGFSCIRQLNVAHPVRQFWWAISRRQVNAYRTHWTARQRGSERVFLKVYFGNADTRVTAIDGENDILLNAFFKTALSGLGAIAVPQVLDHWYELDTVFIAYRWLEMRRISLLRVLREPQLGDDLARLLNELSAVPPPGWWSRGREPRNFACSDYSSSGFEFESPFNMDILNNLAVDNVGRLVFFDFEKYQWTKKGVLETAFAEYVYVSLMRSREVPSPDLLAPLLGHVNLPTRREAQAQAWNVLERLCSAWKIACFSNEEKQQAERFVMRV